MSSANYPDKLLKYVERLYRTESPGQVREFVDTLLDSGTGLSLLDVIPLDTAEEPPAALKDFAPALDEKRWLLARADAFSPLDEFKVRVNRNLAERSWSVAVGQVPVYAPDLARGRALAGRGFRFLVEKDSDGDAGVRFVSQQLPDYEVVGVFRRAPGVRVAPRDRPDQIRTLADNLDVLVNGRPLLTAQLTDAERRYAGAQSVLVGKAAHAVAQFFGYAFVLRLLDAAAGALLYAPTPALAAEIYAAFVGTWTREVDPVPGYQSSIELGANQMKQGPGELGDSDLLDLLTVAARIFSGSPEPLLSTTRLTVAQNQFLADTMPRVFKFLGGAIAPVQAGRRDALETAWGALLSRVETGAAEAVLFESDLGGRVTQVKNAVDAAEHLVSKLRDADGVSSFPLVETFYDDLRERMHWPLFRSAGLAVAQFFQRPSILKSPLRLLGLLLQEDRVELSQLAVLSLVGQSFVAKDDGLAVSDFLRSRYQGNVDEFQQMLDRLRAQRTVAAEPSLEETLLVNAVDWHAALGAQWVSSENLDPFVPGAAGAAGRLAPYADAALERMAQWQLGATDSAGVAARKARQLLKLAAALLAEYTGKKDAEASPIGKIVAELLTDVRRAVPALFQGERPSGPYTTAALANNSLPLSLAEARTARSIVGGVQAKIETGAFDVEARDFNTQIDAVQSLKAFEIVMRALTDLRNVLDAVLAYYTDPARNTQLVLPEFQSNDVDRQVLESAQVRRGADRDATLSLMTRQFSAAVEKLGEMDRLGERLVQKTMKVQRDAVRSVLDLLRAGDAVARVFVPGLASVRGRLLTTIVDTARSLRAVAVNTVLNRALVPPFVFDGPVGERTAGDQFLAAVLLLDASGKLNALLDSSEVNGGDTQLASVAEAEQQSAENRLAVSVRDWLAAQLAVTSEPERREDEQLNRGRLTRAQYAELLQQRQGESAQVPLPGPQLLRDYFEQAIRGVNELDESFDFQIAALERYGEAQRKYFEQTRQQPFVADREIRGDLREPANDAEKENLRYAGTQLWDLANELLSKTWPGATAYVSLDKRDGLKYVDDASATVPVSRAEVLEALAAPNTAPLALNNAGDVFDVCVSAFLARADALPDEPLGALAIAQLLVEMYQSLATFVDRVKELLRDTPKVGLIQATLNTRLVNFVRAVQLVLAPALVRHAGYLRDDLALLSDAEFALVSSILRIDPGRLFEARIGAELPVDIGGFDNALGNIERTIQFLVETVNAWEGGLQPDAKQIAYWQRLGDTGRVYRRAMATVFDFFSQGGLGLENPNWLALLNSGTVRAYLNSGLVSQDLVNKFAASAARPLTLDDIVGWLEQFVREVQGNVDYVVVLAADVESAYSTAQQLAEQMNTGDAFSAGKLASTKSLARVLFSSRESWQQRRSSASARVRPVADWVLAFTGRVADVFLGVAATALSKEELLAVQSASFEQRLENFTKRVTTLLTTLGKDLKKADIDTILLQQRQLAEQSVNVEQGLEIAADLGGQVSVLDEQINAIKGALRRMNLQTVDAVRKAAPAVTAQVGEIARLVAGFQEQADAWRDLALSAFQATGAINVRLNTLEQDMRWIQTNLHSVQYANRLIEQADSFVASGNETVKTVSGKRARGEEQTEQDVAQIGNISREAKRLRSEAENLLLKIRDPDLKARLTRKVEELGALDSGAEGVLKKRQRTQAQADQ